MRLHGGSAWWQCLQIRVTARSPPPDLSRPPGEPQGADRCLSPWPCHAGTEVAAACLLVGHRGGCRPYWGPLNTRSSVGTGQRGSEGAGQTRPLCQSSEFCKPGSLAAWGCHGQLGRLYPEQSSPTKRLN